jgi:hypothetical protein
MITLHENKHITNRYTLAEIHEQMVNGEYSAELLLHHLCLHANEMQSRLEISQLEKFKEAAHTLRQAAARHGLTKPSSLGL